jgi:hypothetical protein
VAKIAALYHEYGMVRCPTGMDILGVLCDGAMPSTLVPITNAVAAILEFVDDCCGILAYSGQRRFSQTGVLLAKCATLPPK